MVTESPTESLPRTGNECPNCGAHADPGQLVCLECGSRLALDYRRPQGWRPAALIIGLVLLVAMAAFALTLVTVDDDSREEVAATKAGQAKPAVKKPKKKAEPKNRESTVRDSRSTVVGVPTWPENRDGFTVVLMSTGDKASARTFARNARDGDVDAGILRSDDFSSLEKGFWIVYSGVYGTREQAERAANRLGSRFSGSYPQFVNGAESG